MIVQCPHCGHSVAVNGLGRKRLNIPLKNVLESLRAYSSIVAAAQELGCSEAYIYSVLKVNGLRFMDVMKKQSQGVSREQDNEDPEVEGH